MKNLMRLTSATATNVSTEEFHVTFEDNTPASLGRIVVLVLLILFLLLILYVVMSSFVYAHKSKLLLACIGK